MLTLSPVALIPTDLVNILDIDISVDDIEPQLCSFETVWAEEIEQHVNFSNEYTVTTDDVKCVTDNDCTLTTNNVKCVTTKDNKSKTKRNITLNKNITVQFPKFRIVLQFIIIPFFVSCIYSDRTVWETTQFGNCDIFKNSTITILSCNKMYIKALNKTDSHLSLNASNCNFHFNRWFKRLTNLLMADWKVGSLANLFQVDSEIDRSLNLFSVELRVNGFNGLEKNFCKIFNVLITSKELDLFNRSVTKHKDAILYIYFNWYGKSSLSLPQDLNLCKLDKGSRVKHVEFSHNCLMFITLNKMLNCVMANLVWQKHALTP